MKMVKSLLLASAAGLAAASGAQAADLPVKAKPVEYVKVCSLYGAGFYYIPGTDICMKIGGYVRYQISTGVGNSISFGPFNTTGGFNTRFVVDDVAQRARVNLTYDTRQQTAYGTLRTYLLLGWTHDSPASAIGPTTPSVYFNRGFIQIAGFTFGKATSFFDFASTAAVAYNAGFLQTSDTGDTGQLVGAYTAQFGNGFSATISVEQSRRANTVYYGSFTFDAKTGAIVFPSIGGAWSWAGAGAGGPNAIGGADNLGALSGNGIASRPDFVANIRVDQAWGSAQIMGAVHDVSAAYYGNGQGVFAPGVAFPGALNALAVNGHGMTEVQGHPDDKWGWAVGAGLRLNAPMIGPGDYFQANAIYSEGAVRYAMFNAGGNGVVNYWTGNEFSWGTAEDAVFGGTLGCNQVGPAAPVPGGIACPFGNQINLTTAWSVFASYEHFWTPALRTSVYGSYSELSRNAQGNQIACAGLGVGWIPAPVALPPAGSGSLLMQCDANWSTWQIGSRSQWNVTKDFYVGVDVTYSKINGMTLNGGGPVFMGVGIPGAPLGPILSSFAAPGNGKPAGIVSPYFTNSQDAVSVTWRVHRDIVP